LSPAPSSQRPPRRSFRRRAREVHAVLLVYHSEEDGKWAGWQAATRLSAKEVGVIVIKSDSDNDDDDNDSEASGEDGEEGDAALNFGAFDYWRR
jgi:hypothetical protein